MLLAREKPLNTKTSLPWRLASLSVLAAAVALAASLAGARPAAGQNTPSAAEPAPAIPAAGAPSLTPPATPLSSQPPAATPPAVAAPPVRPALPATTPPLGLPPSNKLPSAGHSSDAEEAALLAEIGLLQDKLRALEVQRGVPHNPPVLNPSAFVPMGQPPGLKTVTIARADGSGVLWTEVWSVDAKGRPDRLISKNSPAKPTRKAAVLENGTVTEELVEADGSRRMVVLDAATGKVISEFRYVTPEPKPTPAAPATPSADDVVPGPNSRATDLRPTETRNSKRVFSTPVVPGTPRTAVPQYAYQFATNPNMAHGSQQLDLVSLATSYADALGGREAAEAKLAETLNLNEKKLISDQEVTAAKLALSAAKRKEQLLRGIAEAAAATAAQEHKVVSERYEKGAGDVTSVYQTEGRLRILKQILGSQSVEDAPKKP